MVPLILNPSQSCIARKWILMDSRWLGVDLIPTAAKLQLQWVFWFRKWKAGIPRCMSKRWISPDPRSYTAKTFLPCLSFWTCLPFERGLASLPADVGYSQDDPRGKMTRFSRPFNSPWEKTKTTCLTSDYKPSSSAAILV